MSTEQSNIYDFLKDAPHLTFIIDLHSAIKKMGLTMVYEGVVDQELIKTVTPIINEKMTEGGESSRMQKIVFHTVIELLQNMSKYSDEKDNGKGKGIIIVGKTSEEYYVSAGNAIKDEKAEGLGRIMNTINNSSAEELKKMYEQILSNNTFNAFGGAGLGLIDIARKSKQKIEYHFKKMDDNMSFFLVTVRIIKQ